MKIWLDVECLIARFEEVKYYIESSDVDLCAFTETRITRKIDNKEIYIRDYDIQKIGVQGM